MALRKNKKSKRSAAETPEKEQVVARPDKHKGELAKILDPSVWESANEIFKANKKFIMSDGGETRYVAFLFDTWQPQCGGLAGRDAKKDEAKGSIIEAIRGSRINCYLRDEMLREDLILIIPNKDTLDNMDEFNIFRAGEYVLCMVSPDGNVKTVTENGTDADDDPEVKVTFSQIMDIHEKDLDVRSLMPVRKEPEIKGDEAELLEEADAEPAEEPTEEKSAEPEKKVIKPNERPKEPEPEPEKEEEPPAEDTEDLFGDVREDDAPAEDDPPVEELSEPEPAASAAEIAPDVSDLPPAASTVAPAEAPEEEMYPDITEAMVRDFVVQRFYSDDLGLEISTQPFDAQFVHGNPYIPFNENRGSGWLNEYLSNIAKDANTRMRRLHIENLFRMRERYMRLMQMHCENIAKALDITSSETQYGKMRFAIEENYDDNLEKVQSSVTEKRRQLEEAWNEQLRQVGEKGAMDARQEYIARHEAQHNSDMMRLDTLERDEITREFQNAVARLQSDRRREASQMLDMAINSTLHEMSSIYLRILDEEKKEYARLQNEMTKFIDGNRKDEKTRIEALAEANRQAKRADEVRAEFAAKIKSMSAEFDMKRTALQADIDRMNREHNHELARLQNEMKDRLNQEKAHSQQLQMQIDDLTEKLAAADSAAEERYHARVLQLEKENSDFAAQYKHVVTTHKHASTLSVFLIVAAICAAIGIGFALGTMINLRNTSKIEQTGVYNYMQGYEDGENDAKKNMLSDGTEIVIDENGENEAQPDEGQTMNENGGDETPAADDQPVSENVTGGETGTEPINGDGTVEPEGELTP